MPGYFNEDEDDGFGLWLLDRRLLHDDDLIVDDEDRYLPDFAELEDESIDWDDEKDEHWDDEDD